MIKKIVILILGISCFLLAGCKELRSEEREPLTILTTSINYEKFVEAFSVKYPDIKLEFISYKGYNQTGYIRECLEDGELPDIVTTTYFIDGDLQEERLMDLSKYSFVNNYSDSWLNRCNVEGSVYLLPTNYSAIGFYYNKTIMEKYGWELPGNFLELRDLAEKIKEAGLKPCVARMDLEGFVVSDFFGLGNTFFFNTKEGEEWKNNFLTGKADAKGAIEPVLSYFNEWVEAGFISSKDINNLGVSDEFYRGEAVFMLCNGIGTMEQEIEGIGKMEYGIMPWLAPEGESTMIVSNVSRYYGLNKELEKPENLQKLEDALCVMEFMSSEEGMSLLKTDITAISPLNTSHIGEDNVYYEIKEHIIGGNTVPLVYVGWDDIIIPMAQELYSLIRREQTVEECASSFDRIRNQWLQQGPISYGTVNEYISKEEAAVLVGKALLSEKNADVALISLGEFHGFGQENINGIQCGIYPGEFTLDRLRTVVPAGTMSLITLTGKQIYEKKERGKIILPSQWKEEDILPFPYVMVLRNGIELKDQEKYKVVISQADLSEEMKNQVTESWIATQTQKYMESFFLSKKDDITSLRDLLP